MNTKESEQVLAERLTVMEATLVAIKQELFVTRKRLEDIMLAVAGKPEEPVIPDDLKVDRSVKGNKLPETVARRYAVWQQQHLMGMSISAIARAWKCDRRSVQYAQKNNWRAKYV
jgi:hypothetical protein